MPCFAAGATYYTTSALYAGDLDASALNPATDGFPVGSYAILSVPHHTYTGREITRYRWTGTRWTTDPGQEEYFLTFARLSADRPVIQVVGPNGATLWPAPAPSAQPEPQPGQQTPTEAPAAPGPTETTLPAPPRDDEPRPIIISPAVDVIHPAPSPRKTPRGWLLAGGAILLALGGAGVYLATRK